MPLLLLMQNGMVVKLLSAEANFEWKYLTNWVDLGGMVKLHTNDSNGYVWCV